MCIYLSDDLMLATKCLISIILNLLTAEAESIVTFKQAKKESIGAQTKLYPKLSMMLCFTVHPEHTVHLK